jgi:hypothetical protein
MSHKKFCEDLNEFEYQNFKKNMKLSVNESDYAVLLRLLAWKYHNDYVPSSSFYLISTKLIKFLFFIINYLFLNKLLNVFIPLERHDQEIFFYSPKAYYTESIDGKMFSRIIDPLITIINNHYTYIKYSFLKCTDYYYNNKNVSIRPFLNLTDLKYFNKMYYYVQMYASKFHLKKSLLLLELCIFYIKVISYKNLFTKLLLNSRHKFGVTACYYGSEQMGMVWACKNLAIPTIDLQHGKQGPFQPLYAYMSFIPNDGYRLVPDYFWNWGNRSVVDILSHRNENHNHKPIDVGNLWIDFAFNYYTNKKPSFILGSKKVILVTLQDHITCVNNVLPNYIVDQIIFNKNSLWVLVPHPNYPQSKIPIHKFIDDHENCLNFRMYESSSLYEILHWVDFHITGYSSVVHESLYYGVPSGVWRKEGLQIYEKDIKAGLIHDISTSELLNQFFQLPKVPYTKNHSYFSKPKVSEIIQFFK